MVPFIMADDRTMQLIVNAIKSDHNVTQLLTSTLDIPAHENHVKQNKMLQPKKNPGDTKKE